MMLRDSKKGTIRISGKYIGFSWIEWEFHEDFWGFHVKLQ